MLVVIGNMPMVICNRFQVRLANNGKIMTFMGVPLFDTLMRRFLRPSKSTFNAENFIRSLSMSISIGFGAIRS